MILIMIPTTYRPHFSGPSSNQFGHPLGSGVVGVSADEAPGSALDYCRQHATTRIIGFEQHDDGDRCTVSETASKKKKKMRTNNQIIK